MGANILSNRLHNRSREHHSHATPNWLKRQLGLKRSGGRVGTRNATMRASVCRQHADDTPTESPFRHAVSDTDTDAVLLLNLSTKLDPGH